MKRIYALTLSILTILTFIGFNGSLTMMEDEQPQDHITLLVTTLGFDIIKQHEKMLKDPEDMKVTDMHKFKHVCSNPLFVRTYREVFDDTNVNLINQTCLRILELKL
jgi:hypothetical protein